MRVSWIGAFVAASGALMIMVPVVRGEAQVSFILFLPVFVLRGSILPAIGSFLLFLGLTLIALSPFLGHGEVEMEREEAGVIVIGPFPIFVRGKTVWVALLMLLALLLAFLILLVLRLS